VHFLTFVRPGIHLVRILSLSLLGSQLNSFKVCSDECIEDSLNSVLETLRFAQRVYQDPLSRFIFTAFESLYHSDAAQIEIEQVGSKFKRDLHAIIAYSLPHEEFSTILAKVLTKEGTIILGIASEDNARGSRTNNDGDEASVGVEGDMETKQDLRTDAEGARRLKQNFERSQSQTALEARRRAIDIGCRLQEVGLGGVRGERVLAEVMNKLMTEYITKTFAGQWQSPSTVTTQLKTWMEDKFGRLVFEMLSCFTGSRENGTRLRKQQSAEEEQVELLVTFEDVEKWSEMGVGRLGRLRISELFGIVVDWDSSMGAIEDLKVCLIPLPPEYFGA
jgi:anaphase-promoting complex subunit 2